MFFGSQDRVLGAACVRAWNDWLYEEWHLRHPERIIALVIAYLADPEMAVAEIRRNAARGFVSVRLLEHPDAVGLPSLWDRDHWDPIIEACVDTGTVLSLRIGWVAMLLDRLDYIVDHSDYAAGWSERPSEVLVRNFWFCTLEDHSTIDTRYRIGVDHITVEVDYRHGDSSWPDTQAVIEHAWGHVPPAELRALCCENAARLYCHPLPEIVLPVVV